MMEENEICPGKGSQEEESPKAALAAEPLPVTYTKEQLLHASRYRGQRDLLQALLSDDTGYSFQEVDKLLKHYLKGKVK